VIVTGTFVSAGGALWSSGERTKFERELRDKSDQITQLSQEAAASVTGGDSFCYLSPIAGYSMTGTAAMFLHHEGAYPLYDVNMHIVDLQKARQADAGQIEQSDWSAWSGTNYDLRNLVPTTARQWGVWQLPNADEQDYDLFFVARNGHWTQELRFRRVDGQWKQAIRVRQVTATAGSPPLYESVESGFPLNEQGQVK